MNYNKFDIKTFRSNDLGKLAGSLSRHIEAAKRGNAASRDWLWSVVDITAAKINVNFGQMWQAMQSADPIKHLLAVQHKKGLPVKHEQYSKHVLSAFSDSLTLRHPSDSIPVDAFHRMCFIPKDTKSRHEAETAKAVIASTMRAALNN